MKSSNGCGRRWAVSVVLAAVLAIGAGVSQAGTIYVSPSGDDVNDGLTWATAKRTVQAGSDAATAGDEVWVAAGTYVENIMLKAEVALYGGFAGGETALLQRDWAVNETILDGNQAGSVVTVQQGATLATRIDGFTVRNGNASTGGGICSENASVEVANSVITGNQGGGIYTTYGSVNVTGSNISHNGRGIYCGNYATATITDNTITDNAGGGIRCETTGLTAIGNLIKGNWTSTRTGGGIRTAGGTIANNVIVGNWATDSDGGGVWCASGLIANNTIVGNGATGAGGGIYCPSSALAPPTIVNTIVAFNSSGIFNYATVAPSVRNTCVYGNSAYNYRGMVDPTGTNGNISSDPRLEDIVYGRFHIQPVSPCIDAGDDSAVQPAWLDMDGQARVLGTHVDIGADESDGTLWPAAGPNIVVRVSPAGDDANDGSSWTLAKRTVQAGIKAAALEGGEVWVAKGAYLEAIVLKNFVHVYGGFVGTETQRSERDWASHATELTGNGFDKVVTANQGGPCTIDGFTIRNFGWDHYGGGILCEGTYLTVADCTVTDVNADGGAIECLDASAVIRNNRIVGTVGDGSDGAICCTNGSPTIANNTITDNAGSGIRCSASSATITGNLIARNNSSTLGGGIHCVGTSSVTITGNTVLDNKANLSGGGIWCGASSGIIANNLISGNSAFDRGGGIWCPTSITIANNTITNNRAAGGGGMYFLSVSSATVVNTIVAFNSSGIHQPAGTGVLTLRNCCVYGNKGFNYAGLSDQTGINGNISADPLFASASPGPDGFWGTADDTYADLRLLPGSPCIDAGRNADVPADMADLDGDGNVAEPLPVDLAGGARFLDDPQVTDTGAGTVPIVDMGAYERCRPVGDVDGDWLTDVVDLLYVVDAFGTASGDPGYDARCDFNGDGAVDVVDLLDLVYGFGK